MENMKETNHLGNADIAGRIIIQNYIFKV